MDWMELTVLTTTAGADMVSQILMDAGSLGTMIEDKNDVAANQRPEGQWDIIDEAIAQRIGDDVKVTGYYEVDASLNDRVRMVEGEIRRIKAMDLGFDAGKLELLNKTFAEEDWAENWKKSFKPLRLGEHMQRQRRLTGGLRSVDLNDSALRHATDAERCVERQRAGRNRFHVHLRAVAQTHDRALAEILFDLQQRSIEGLSLIAGGGGRFISRFL